MNLQRKPLVNSRKSAKRTVSPEPIKVILLNEEHIAVLSETPQSPETTIVTIGNSNRTYVSYSPPLAGEFTIKKNDKDRFTPILQFNAIDSNKDGTCDYYGLGTTLCSEHIEVESNFNQPLITEAANIEALTLIVPPQTVSKDTRGFPGDQALLSNKDIVYSTGEKWKPIRAEAEELRKTVTLTSPEVTGIIGQISVGTIITLKVASTSTDKYSIEFYDGPTDYGSVIYSKQDIEGNSADNIVFSSDIIYGTIYYKLTNNNEDNAEGSVVLSYKFKYI